MIIGIDIGGTNTQGVLFDKKRMVAFFSLEGNKATQLNRCYRFLGKKAGNDLKKVVLTGGGSRNIRPIHIKEKTGYVNEIEAIGNGGKFLSKKKDIFVVSIGTGTAFVSVKKGKAKHAGGTGIGGGTIYGLSKLMLGMPLNKVENIAKKSKVDLDLTVKDIVGGGIGKVPGYATASNFGKAKKTSNKTEIASSLLKMIGETIGSMAFFAAKGVNQEKKILICGRVAMNGVVKKKVIHTIKMLGGDAKIPRGAEFGAAIGAAVSKR